MVVRKLNFESHFVGASRKVNGPWMHIVLINDQSRKTSKNFKRMNEDEKEYHS